MGQYSPPEVQHILDLAFRCTDLTDPASRPSMGRVVAEIEAVLEPERRISGPLPPSRPLPSAHPEPTPPGRRGTSRQQGVQGRLMGRLQRQRQRGWG